MTDEAWIDTVRLARDFGTVHTLFPEGIDDLRDLPHPLFNDILTAMSYLSFEELEKKERPPRSIWQDPEALREWFDGVERDRREGNERNPIEDPVDNEAAKGLLVG